MTQSSKYLNIFSLFYFIGNQLVEIKLSIEDNNKEYCIYCKREIIGEELKFRAHKECILEFENNVIHRDYIDFRDFKVFRSDFNNWVKLAEVYGRPIFGYKQYLVSDGTYYNYSYISPYYEDEDFSKDIFGNYPFSNFDLEFLFDVDFNDDIFVYKILLADRHVKSIKNIQNQHASTLSQFFFSFPELIRLKIVQDSLTIIPDLFTKLPNLESLKIRAPHLESLPKSISTLSALKDLFIGVNFTEVPDFICEMNQLRLLSLEINNVKRLPASLKNLVNLSHFYLESDSITEFPELIYDYQHLEYLFLNLIHVEYLPNPKKPHRGLKRIFWFLNSLKELPDDFDNFGVLEDFYLYVPGLVTLKGISNIRAESLTLIINTDFNLNETLSDTIRNFTLIAHKVAIFPRFPSKLKYLSLFLEDLDSLPDNLFNCTELERLIIVSKNLHSLPQKFVQLRELKYLKIVNTVITELPDYLFLMPKLTVITINKDTRYDRAMNLHNIRVHSDDKSDDSFAILSLNYSAGNKKISSLRGMHMLVKEPDL